MPLVSSRGSRGQRGQEGTQEGTGGEEGKGKEGRALCSNLQLHLSGNPPMFGDLTYIFVLVCCAQGRDVFDNLISVGTRLDTSGLL